MTRTEIIQSLINKHNYKSYLEIGVQDGYNFNAIVCDYKLGVDPDPNSAATYFDTSDNFFKNNIQLFNLIFVDGFHSYAQVKNDILNALAHLKDKGIIVCHDMLPISKEHSDNPYLNGDCWKAVAELNMESDNLYIRTIDTDQGCALISKEPRSQFRTLKRELSWENFEIYKEEWLNIISVEQFKASL